MKFAYRASVREHNGYYLGTLAMNLGGGASVVVRSKVSIEQIANLLGKTFQGQWGSDEMLGEVGFFGSLWKGVKSVARKVAKSKVLRTAGKVIQNPAFRAIAAQIPGVSNVMGAIDAANAGISAANSVSKLVNSGAPRSQVMAQRGRALELKKRVATRARAAGLPFAQFQRAWASGWGAVPDPRLVRQLRTAPQASALFQQFLPQATRGFTAAMPQAFAALTA